MIVVSLLFFFSPCILQTDPDVKNIMHVNLTHGQAASLFQAMHRRLHDDVLYNHTDNDSTRQMVEFSPLEPPLTP
jgi:hypothetical protein